VHPYVGMILAVNGIIILPISFVLLTIGPSLISAPEVSLYMLTETIVGPIWVFLAGFGAPRRHTLIGGGIMIFALGIHSLFALQEHAKMNYKMKNFMKVYVDKRENASDDGSENSNRKKGHSKDKIYPIPVIVKPAVLKVCPTAESSDKDENEEAEMVSTSMEV
jgi:hypothetical protein